MVSKIGTTPLAAVLESSPAVVDGVVYVVSNDGNVYALNAANGAKLWSSLTAAMLIRLLLLSAAWFT